MTARSRRADAALLAAVYATTPALLAPGALTDWGYFDQASRVLLGRHALQLYALRPDVQIGPAALLVAAPFRGLQSHAPIAVAVVIGLMAVPVLIGARHAAEADRARLYLVAALALLPWTELAVRCHLDDAMAVLALCLAARAARSQRDVLAALLVVAGTAAKPWALVGVALVFVLTERRARFVVLVASFVTLAWAPFVVASGSAGLQIVNHVTSDSLLGALGAPDGARLPTWYRPLQLFLAVVVALLVASRRPAAGVLAGTAARTLLEPIAVSYYAASLTMLAADADLEERRAFPSRALAGLAIWAVPLAGRSRGFALAYLGTLVALLVLSLPRPGHRAVSASTRDTT